MVILTAISTQWHEHSGDQQSASKMCRFAKRDHILLHNNDVTGAFLTLLILSPPSIQHCRILLKF